MESLGPLILVAMVVAFYFLLVRPQNRRMRERQRLISSLDVGNHVVTAGGFHGRIVELHDETMELEIAPGTTVRIERSAAVRSGEAEGAHAAEDTTMADGSTVDEGSDDGATRSGTVAAEHE